MNRILFFLIIICSKIICAQTENYKTTFKSFQSDYNSEKYHEIFNTFSLEFQNNFPLEGCKQFFSNLKSQYGNILNKEIINNESETGVVYKTQFENNILNIHITLNDTSKITSLLIKPYEAPVKTEIASINKLQNYPTNIGDLIFSKVKSLPNNAQLSIAVIQNGKTNYYGIIRSNKTIMPIENHNKIFEIGSITKVFTATVLASMVNDNKIKLASEINSFYPFNFKNNTKITFESLANHTSGLPRLPENFDFTNTQNPYKNYGSNKIEEYLKDFLKLNNQEEKNYNYSNLGAGLLGYTLGLSQKTTFQEILQKSVFEKYHMNNSFTTSQNLGNKLVKGLDQNGNVVTNWDFDVLFGGGGILSTTEDLGNFVKAHFKPENKELLLTRQPTFVVNDNLKMGLGWYILKSKKGINLYFHNGGTGGYSSSISFDTDNKTAIIILSNVYNANKIIDSLGNELMNTTNKQNQ